MASINFTKEHLAQLEKAMIKQLFDGSAIKGPMGTTLNAHQLLHETSVKSLQQLYVTTTKVIENQSKLDRWSMSDYQQSKLEELKSQAELLDLIIGFKKFEALKEANKIKLEEKRELLNTLRDQSKTPSERIQELESEIAELEA